MNVGGHIGTTKNGEDWERPAVAHRVDVGVRGQLKESLKTEDHGGQGLTEHGEDRVARGLNQVAKAQEHELRLFSQHYVESLLHNQVISIVESD